MQHTFFVHFFAVILHDYNVKLPETLCWYFLFFSFSCSTKIDSEELLWLDADFKCVTRTSKNVVSPRDDTIASLSINTEGGSAALVLTPKQEAIARHLPSVCLSNFSNVRCRSCCHIVRSSFAHNLRSPS